MKIALIDDVTGLWIEDQIVPDTITTNNGGTAPYPLKPNQIPGDVPGGLFHPKWDGMKWIEGADPSVIAAAKTSKPAPDYETLIKALSDNTNPLKAIVSTTKDQLALISLITEIHNPDPRFEIVKIHWDNMISGLPSPLPDGDRTAFLALAVATHMPFTLDSSNKLTAI